jgi:Mg2+/Co2+ transporter CorB
MSLEYVLLSGAIFVLLILSAFFSGSETALTGASLPRMHELARQGDRRAMIVLALYEQRERLIGAILLGNNLVNILSTSLATTAFLFLLGDAGVVYATIVMTLLVLIFAEVAPKTYALARADKTALMVAPIIRVIVFLFAPITHSIHVFINATLKLFGVEFAEGVDREESEQELRGAIALHKGPEPEIRHERQMLHSILELDDVEVGEVMTHRRNVTMIDADLPTSEILQLVFDSPFTRLPLYRSNADDIVGILHVKSLLREFGARRGDVEGIDIVSLSVQPWFIPETTTLLDQLLAFRERREHFANVVDEYGAFMGIVTLEDILEEIVGEIDDEHDTIVRGVRPQPDGSYIVDGTVTLRDLNREFEWYLPDDEASTVAGLVLHESRMIPEPGQVFNFHGFRFEILRRQRNQIVSLRVTPQIPSETASTD